MKTLFFILLLPSFAIAEDLSGKWSGRWTVTTDTCGIAEERVSDFSFRVREGKSAVTVKAPGNPALRGIKIGKRGIYAGRNEHTLAGCVRSEVLRLDKLKGKNKAKIFYRFVGECGFFPGPDCEFEASGTAKRE